MKDNGRDEYADATTGKELVQIEQGLPIRLGLARAGCRCSARVRT